MFQLSKGESNTVAGKSVDNETVVEGSLADTYFTVAEVAEFLRVHHTTIYRLIKKQDLPAFKIGADWRFSKQAIEKWLAARQKPKKTQ
jgi:excisionase family DNA binding protein